MKTSTIIILLVILILIGIAGLIFYPLMKSDDIQQTDSTKIEEVTDTATTANAVVSEPYEITPGLVAQELVVGTGDIAKIGDKIAVHYIGKLDDGTVFDSSIPRKQPFVFNLGAGMVIEGWEKGFVGMKVGGTRKLVIAPELAYGDREIGTIPANSRLTFEVALLAIVTDEMIKQAEDAAKAGGTQTQ